MPEFICSTCGETFSLTQNVLDRYPGWTPRSCLSCKNSGGSSRKGSSPTPATEEDPTTGIFTDGSSVPNPGPGGWGAVYVEDNTVVAEACGYGGETTNNRMELTALIRAVDLVPTGHATTVYSDSKLAVQTINEWAAGWERRGWKRKSGAVENLDLVKDAYRLYTSRPELSLVWIKAHVGFTWNEYADELANRGRMQGS
ncbi:MAG: ribonuclease HI [Actinomycetia bacterium]|nr:ribonuclease HI [Actinomycetes bacterium]